MQAALSSPHPATSAAPVLSGVLPPAAAVDSQALLQGQKAITITHNGAVYR